MKYSTRKYRNIRRNMKVVTLYSPSHKQMMDEFFIPSFPKDERLQLKIIESPQVAGELPTFNSEQWTEFMKIKSQVLYDELVSTSENDIYLFLDVDIINVNNFYYYLTDRMKYWDVITQSDSPFPQFPNYCTGIVCVKNNERSRSLFKAVNMIMHGHKLFDNQPAFKNEQEVFTYMAVNKLKFLELRDLQITTFPFDVAFTYGAIGGKVWDGTDTNFNIPDKKHLLWLHANFAHHNMKIPLLELFKEKLK